MGNEFPELVTLDSFATVAQTYQCIATVCTFDDTGKKQYQDCA